MASDITGGVQAMEAEAARVLDEAKAKASDIVQKARDESRKMADAELRLDDVKAECASVVEEATRKADRNVKEAEQQAADIKSSVGKKADQSAKMIVSIVIGEKAA